MFNLLRIHEHAHTHRIHSHHSEPLPPFDGHRLQRTNFVDSVIILPLRIEHGSKNIFNLKYFIHNF